MFKVQRVESKFHLTSRKLQSNFRNGNLNVLLVFNKRKCSVDTQSLMGDGQAFTLSDKQKHDVFHPSNCKRGNVFTI